MQQVCTAGAVCKAYCCGQNHIIASPIFYSSVLSLQVCPSNLLYNLSQEHDSSKQQPNSGIEPELQQGDESLVFKPMSERMLLFHS